MADGDLRIEARLHMASDRLRIEYRATSAASGPLFLFNILHDEFDDGVFPLDRGGYVEIDGDGVVVSRKLFAVPSGTLAEKPNIPFLTRLVPGETFQEDFTVALPLAARNPYVDPSPTAGQPFEGRPLMFELGYFAGAEGTEAQGKLFPTDAGDKPGFDVFTPANQRLVRTAALGTVPVVTGGRPA